MAKTCRILMPTDIPFWRRCDGAQQRIAALADRLSASPFALQIFYLGPWTPDDERHVAAQPWTVERFQSNEPPQRWTAKLRWYWHATWNQWDRGWKPWLAPGDSESTSIESQPAANKDPSEDNSAKANRTSLSLSDYRWPWVGEKFLEVVDAFQPQVILCQYITLSYLLESLPRHRRQSILCAVDTHDLLHRRGAQFQQAGLSHWLDVDLSQEVAAWNQFDLILAIQSDEARFIEQHVTKAEVLVVGHDAHRTRDSDSGVTFTSMNLESPTEGAGDESRVLVLGYLASANDSNREAIDWFLSECWPTILKTKPGKFHLAIAGGIGRYVDECWWPRLSPAVHASIRMLGPIESLSPFYQQVDLTLNPVRLGTGLKIKNIESLAYGVPVITTPEGAQGMPIESLLAGCRVVDRRDFVAELCQLTGRQLTAMRHQLQRVRKTSASTSPHDALVQRLLGLLKPDIDV